MDSVAVPLTLWLRVPVSHLLTLGLAEVEAVRDTESVPLLLADWLRVRVTHLEMVGETVAVELTE